MLSRLSLRLREKTIPVPCGRRIALIIGINYVGTPYELGGCYNDAISIKGMLKQQCNVPEEDIVLLTDAVPDARLPTHAAIENNLETIRQIAIQYNSRPITLFFYYSGHGGFSPNPTERHKRDSTLYPIDSIESPQRVFSDNKLNRIFQRFPAKTNIVCINDCCYSGTLTDLPHVYENKKFYRDITPIMNCNVITLSASTDIQLAFETGGHGVMTDHLVNIVSAQNRKMSWLRLCNALNTQITPLVPQHAVLSVSKVRLYDIAAFTPDF